MRFTERYVATEIQHTDPRSATNKAAMTAICRMSPMSFMARVAEVVGKYALNPTSRPPCNFPRGPSGAGRSHSVNRRVRTSAGPERGPLPAQELFHRGL